MKNNKLKNYVWIGLAAVVIGVLVSLAFCAREEEEPSAPVTESSKPESAIPSTPEEPKWEAGEIRADYGEGVYKSFAYGTQLNVIGEHKEYYVVQGEDYDLLVNKQFVRLSSEEGFTPWSGYAYSGAEVFSTVYMRDAEPIAVLNSNTELTVEEGKDNWLKVSWAQGKGYMLKDDVSKYRLGGGGGGSSAPAAAPEEPSDGTDVPITDLCAKGYGNGLVPLGKYYGPEIEGEFTPGAALVIAEDIEAYLMLFKRGDEVKVTEVNEEFCTVWIEEEIFVKLPRWLIKLEGDEEYVSRKVFAAHNAVVYGDYQLLNENTTLERNAEVVIIDEIPDKYSFYYEGCYVVTVNGQLGYMLKDSVSDTEYSIPTYNGGGGAIESNQSSSGGDVWTPPALVIR